MKYAVEMGSGALIYIPIFTITRSGIPMLIGAAKFTDTDSLEIA
jgi:hypothetical protein